MSQKKVFIRFFFIFVFIILVNAIVIAPMCMSQSVYKRTENNVRIYFLLSKEQITVPYNTSMNGSIAAVSVNGTVEVICPDDAIVKIDNLHPVFNESGWTGNASPQSFTFKGPGNESVEWTINIPASPKNTTMIADAEVEVYGILRPTVTSSSDILHIYVNNLSQNNTPISPGQDTSEIHEQGINFEQVSDLAVIITFLVISGTAVYILYRQKVKNK